MATRSWLVFMVLGLVLALCRPEPAAAQGRVQAARAAAEFLIERFGPQAARQGVAALARRIETMAATHGDQVFIAIRKVGPRFFEVVEAAGANGTKAVRLMATHGEPGVAWVVSRPTAMKLLAMHGEEAVAGVLVKHPGAICEPVIERFGAPAVKALGAVGQQSGRRMSMMLADGELAKIGRTPEVLGVVAQYGDRAMEFIWKHKYTLAGTAALTAFLAHPEPFLDGGKDITKIAAENAVRPLAEVPGKVATEAARQINWNLVVILALLVATGLAVVFVSRMSRYRQLLGSWLGSRDSKDCITPTRVAASATPPPAEANLTCPARSAGGL
jgi:hypothetical protein